MNSSAGRVTVRAVVRSSQREQRVRVLEQVLRLGERRLEPLVQLHRPRQHRRADLQRPVHRRQRAGQLLRRGAQPPREVGEVGHEGPLHRNDSIETAIVGGFSIVSRAAVAEMAANVSAMSVNRSACDARHRRHLRGCAADLEEERSSSVSSSERFCITGVSARKNGLSAAMARLSDWPRPANALPKPSVAVWMSAAVAVEGREEVLVLERLGGELDRDRVAGGPACACRAG